MEQTLKIIEIISLVSALIFGGTLFWEIKSNGSISCKVTQLIFVTEMFILQIPRLVLRIFLNQPYASVIILLGIWVLNIAIDAFLIGAEMGENSAYMNITIEILNNNDERCQEDSKEKNDNQ